MKWICTIKLNSVYHSVLIVLKWKKIYCRFTIHCIDWIFKSQEKLPKKHIHWLYRFLAHFSFPGSSEVFDSFATMHSLWSSAQWKANAALTRVSVSSGLGLHFHGSLWTPALTMFKSFQKIHTRNPKKILFCFFFFVVVCFLFCFGWLVGFLFLQGQG